MMTKWVYTITGRFNSPIEIPKESERQYRHRFFNQITRDGVMCFKNGSYKMTMISRKSPDNATMGKMVERLDAVAESFSREVVNGSFTWWHM